MSLLSRYVEKWTSLKLKCLLSQICETLVCGKGTGGAGKQTGAPIPAFDAMDSMTLEDLVGMKMVDAMADVEKVAERSSKEFQIEVALDKMFAAWEDVPLVVEMYRNTGTCILKGVDEYMALLDEHITMTQAMALSAFKGPFDERIDLWNNSLQIVSEVIDEWITLQRNWLYLQPIFDSADINKQLPQEGKRFATVDKYWRSTMAMAIKECFASNSATTHDYWKDSAKATSSWMLYKKV